MKVLLVTTFFIVASSAFANIGDLEGSARYTQGVYEGSCYFTRPLYVYESCNPHSAIGRAVIHCAFDKALAKCERDGNLDCILVENSGYAWPYQSADFPGYLRCNGSAVVRGYK